MKNKILTRKHKILTRKHKILTRKHRTFKKKITRKNNKPSKKHNHTKNMKLIIGGTDNPKINFPYIYLIFTFAKFNAMSEPIKQKFNYYLNEQTSKCDSIAVKGTTSVESNFNQAFLNNEQEYCVLVLKYNDYKGFLLDPNLLEDDNFLNKILGHTKLIHYPKQNTIGIFNVCLHRIDYLPNNQKTEKNKPGYGSVLFNTVLTSIKHLIAEKKLPITRLWLGIDIKNQAFDKVAWIYTSKGFGNPKLNDLTPDGNPTNVEFIELTKSPNSYINDEDETLFSFYATIDLYKQTKTTLGQEGIVSFTFGFDNSAILSLRLLPFISFDKNAQSNPTSSGIEPDEETQRETSGKFDIYNYYLNKNDNNKLYYKLSLEIVNELINFNIGKKDTVLWPEGQKTFHTHPLINYITNNVLIGPPSSLDLIAFTDSVIKNIYNPRLKKQQFHTVISVEGIYIFSISERGWVMIKENRLPINIIKMIQDNCEYPLDKRKYDWSNYNWKALDITTTTDEVKQKIEEYLSWFNQKNNVIFENLFDMQFIPWNQLDRNTLFTIYYYNGKPIQLKNAPIDVDGEPMDVVIDSTNEGIVPMEMDDESTNMV